MKTAFLTLGDKLFIVLAIAALGAIIGMLYQPKQQATHVDILHGSELVHRLDLSTDQSITVDGDIGESVIEISQGQARFIHAPCRQQVCIHNGWLGHQGGLAACLPNRVAIRLHAPND